MSEADRIREPSRCLFCRMPNADRFLGVPVCPICRDQLYDFVWASGVQGIVVVVGGLSSAWFLAEEAMLFVVLVLVKHRFPPPWERKR
jgi:hypothetical protein